MEAVGMGPAPVPVAPTRPRSREDIEHHYRVEIELADLPTRLPPDDLLALDEALARLEQIDSVKARLVNLRYFTGMTIEQAAEVLNISRTTAHRYWTFSRAWLHQQMTGDRPC